MTSYLDLLDEAPEYALKVRQYAGLLIDQRIWDSISHDDVDKWLKNFNGPEETLLAALLLDNLVYRSAAQTASLLTSALVSALPHAMYDNPYSVMEGTNFLTLFRSKSLEDSVRIVPVIRDADPPTKSGPSIARMYRRHLNINDRYMIWPWLVKNSYDKGVRNFVLIDDVLATGQQAAGFLNDLNAENCSEARFVYIPLLAHSDGVRSLRDSNPSLIISPVETLGADSCFFKMGVNSKIDDLEGLYLKIEREKVNKRLLNKMSKGYGGLSLTFSYYHATPNASLPLYWYESEQFSPLVRR